MSNPNLCSICGRERSTFEQYDPHDCNPTITKDQLVLVKFASAMLKYWHENPEYLFDTEDGIDYCDNVLIPCGMVELVPYNKEKHGDVDCDEGDMIYAWTQEAQAALASVLAKEKKP